MKILIKKILRESDDGLGWMDEIPTSLNKDNLPSVGDTLICVPGFSNERNDYGGQAHLEHDYGGSGYVEGSVITVGSIDLRHHRPVVWPEEGGGGIFVDALMYHQSINESDDLSWMDDIVPDILMAGTMIIITSVGGNDSHRHLRDDYGILKITEVSDEDVTYSVITSNGGGWHGNTTSLKNARSLLEQDYWRLLSPTIPKTLISWRPQDPKVFLPYITPTFNTDSPGDSVNESDDLSWMDDIRPAIKLKPKTIYYFDPNITSDEIPDFANRITNSDHTKDWLFRMSLNDWVLKGGMKYFVTNKDLTRVTGFSVSMPNVKERYPNHDFINVREELL